MGYLILLMAFLGVVWFVSAPFRRASTAPDGMHEPEFESLERIDLEAARDAKYREIRDAELDHQTGKLSDEDYEAIDSTLRTEAIEVLHQLDTLDERAALVREDHETPAPARQGGAEGEASRPE
jgi:hypothetical protein